MIKIKKNRIIAKNLLIYLKKGYRIFKYKFLQGENFLKKFLSIILALFVVSLFPLCSFIGLNSYKNKGSGDVRKGLSVLEKLDNMDTSKIQARFDEIEKRRLALLEQENRRKAAEKTIQKIENGTLSYRKVLSDVYIAGDSLMEGLEAYGILNSNHIFAKVSASLYHLEENYNNIVAVNPKILILHYGLNMIGTEDYHLEAFIKQYKGLVERFKKSLPNTRIVISLLFPVDTSVATAARFKCVDKYNAGLMKMCKEEKLEYLDSASVFKGNYFYGADGIHLSATFYSQYWLKHIIAELEIY